MTDETELSEAEQWIGALTDPSRRLVAASHLGEMKCREAVPALVRNLGVSNDLDRQATVTALGRIGDPSAVDRLLEVARDDEAAGVRVNAINSLAMLGAPEGIAMFAVLVINPRTLLGTSSRHLDLMFTRKLSGRQLRRYSQWAASRLQELGATEAIPTLEAAIGTNRRSCDRRLRRTVRALQQ